ncbi:MAG: diguanylate cyclase [Solirubrobacteraceae bacterium]
MAPGPLDRHAEERRLLTRPLAILHVIGSTLSVLWLLSPHAAGADEPLIWAATLGAYAIAALLLAHGEQLPPRAVQAAMLGTTFVISVAVAASAEPGSVYGLFYLWATLYAFCFFTKRQAFFQVAAVGVMYGAALLLQLADTPWFEDLTRWCMTLGTLLAAAWLVRSLTDRLREREQHLRLGIEQSGIGSLTIGLDGTILVANDAFARLVGVQRASLPGTSADRFRHPEDRDRVIQRRRLALAGSAEGYAYESRLRRADGEYGWVAITSSIVRDDRGRPLHIFGQVEDITARVRHSARQSGLTRLGRLALGGAEGDELAAGAAAIVARALEVPRVALTLSPGPGAAPQLAAAHGWSDEDAGFALAAGMLDPPPGDAVLEHDTRITGTERGSLVRAAVRGADGPIGALCAHGGARLLEREDALFMEAAASVLGTALARLDADRRVRHQALHDPLTGLPNRALLVDRLEHELARARRDGTGVGAIFVDLDHFKGVNDRLGHEAGDELLRQVAKRLAAVSREDETLARLGGDEFVVVTACEGGAATLLPHAERLRAALAEPFPLPGGEHRLDASLGVAVAARDGDGAALLRDADAAMYRAKQLGRGRSELYEVGRGRLIRAPR